MPLQRLTRSASMARREQLMNRKRLVGACALVLGIVLAAGATPASATTWLAGDLTTFTQSDWGDVPNGSNAASLLDVNYATVYSSTMGLVEIGVPGAAGFSALYTGSSQV